MLITALYTVKHEKSVKIFPGEQLKKQGLLTPLVIVSYKIEVKSRIFIELKYTDSYLLHDFKTCVRT